MRKNTLVDLGLVVLLLVFPFILYWNQLISGTVLAPGEGMMSFSTKIFEYKTLTSGQIPLWNSYIITGAPFLGAPENTSFYPLNALALVFPPTVFSNLFYIIHLGLAGLFSYLYINRVSRNKLIAVSGGIIFSASSIIGGYRKDHVLLYTAIIWLPLILYFIQCYLDESKKRFLIFSSFFMTIQLFGGHPQYALYSDIIAFIYLIVFQVVKRTRILDILRSMVLLVGPYLLFSAIEILPTAQMIMQSGRNGQINYFCLYSTSWENLLIAIFPYIYGPNILAPLGPSASSGVDYELYLGIVPLIYGLYAIRYHITKPLILFSAITISITYIYASNCNIPILATVLQRIPFLNSFGVQSRILFIYVFFSLICFAVGIADIQDRRNAKRLFSFNLLAFGIIILLALTISAVARSPLFNGIGSNYYFLTSTAFRASFVIALLNLLLIGGLYALHNYPDIYSRAGIIVTIILVIITIVDIGRFSTRYDHANLKSAEINTEETNTLSKLLGQDPYRILTVYDQVYGGSYYKSGLVDNWSMVNGIRNIKGFSEFDNPRLNELLRQSDSRDNTNARQLLGEGNILSMLSVRYVLSPVDQELPELSNPNYKLVASTELYNIFENERAQKLVYIPDQVKTINDDSDLRNAPSKYPQMDQISYVKGFHDIQTGGKLEILSVTNNSLTAHVSSPRDTFVNHAQSFYPGWKATIDGQVTPIYLVNGVIQGIEVPSGNHEVKFQYDPPTLKLGAAISLVSFLLAVIFVILDNRWGQKKQSVVTHPEVYQPLNEPR